MKRLISPWTGERKQRWEGGLAGLCGLSEPVGVLQLCRGVYTVCLVGMSASFQVCPCVFRLSCFNALTQAQRALMRGGLNCFSLSFRVVTDALTLI